ncbi:hypothetical protein ABPG74_010014 [Tetrahymena malaccensis]
MDNLKSPQLYSCKKHVDNKISFLKTTFYDQEDILKCGQCAIEDISIKDYIHIETVNNSKDGSFLKYWPPLCDEYLHDEIQHLLENQIDPIKKIEENFNNLKDDLVNLVEQKKKSILQYVLSQKVKHSEILQIYNGTSKISKLKQILASNKDREQTHSDLKDFLSEMNQLKQQNTLLLLETVIRLKRYNQIDGIFQLDPIKKIIQNNLDKLEEQVLKNKELDEKCKDIKQSINALIAENSHYDKQSLIQKFYDGANYLQKQYAMYEFNLLKRTFSSQFQYKKNTNCIEKLFGQASFCDYQQSSYIKVLENSIEKKIAIIKHNYVNQGCIYFKYELKQFKKYIIRFQFNHKADDWITLGLINSNNLLFRLSDSHHGKAFGKQFDQFGGDIVKGSYFFNVNEKDIIEMKVNISNQQIQYIDISQSNSINQLNKEFLLDKESTYYLALDFGTNSRYFNTQIDIISFKEVDNI